MFRIFIAVTIIVSLSKALPGHSLPDLTIEEIFTEENANPLSVEHGIRLNNAAPSLLQSLQKEYGVAKIIDAGCGDADWLYSTLPCFDYLGIDIVESVVEKNREKYGDEKINFLKLDITQDSIPQADLILCTDCFEWFAYFDIYSTLEQFKDSNSTYLVASTCPDFFENRETSTGVKRIINLQSYPFYFPPPIKLIKKGDDSEGYLALWKLDEIDLSRYHKALFPPMTVLSKSVGQGLKWEHVGVMNSIRRGLPRIHRDFNINPDLYDLVKANVVVVANINAGLEAYQWKQNNLIDTLMLGPNIVGFPQEADSLISWPLVDAYLTPSEWPAENVIRMVPLLQGRTRIWFAGVDENYWKPTAKFSEKEKNKVLVYRKTNHEISDHVEAILQASGFSVFSVAYGSYSPPDFKELLLQCKFAVFVSKCESQGIALVEAWSMDVPTLVWNPKETVHYIGLEWKNVSSCPYLNPMVGKEWSSFDEFKTLLTDFETGSLLYQPRRWVLLNMTDKISAQTLVGLVREVNVNKDNFLKENIEP